jgi:iron complex outermembrane recepter protein
MATAPCSQKLICLWAISISLLVNNPPDFAFAESKSSRRTSIEELKTLPLEELLAQEVTSATGTSRQLSRVATAIDVINQNDIRRSGYNSLAELMRLGTGLNVARTDARTWAISARGFNTTTSNKLEIRMDGRSLYTPLFSGVFWDVQDYMLEDIDRIEVIRGPGATLWGANAVNGVVNIITKSSAETQGGLVHVGGGLEEQFFTGARYGGKVQDLGHYRVYGKYFMRDELLTTGGAGAGDEWDKGQGGFRSDLNLKGDNLLTIQGDAYVGEENVLNQRDTEVSGANFLSRLVHTFNPDSDVQFRFYYDYTFRNISKLFQQKLNTYDFDARHRLEMVEGHSILYGLGYRLAVDEIVNSVPLAFLPADASFQTVSGLIQDEITVVPEKLALVTGIKLEHNDFTGFEVQPSLRGVWTPSEKHTVWAGISRAVRTPSRIDEDFVISSAAGNVLLVGDDDFKSETLMAYELGYRVQPYKSLGFDLVGFYHDYDHIRSVEPEPPTGSTFVIENLLEGETYGVEALTTYSPTSWWRLKMGYTHLRKALRRKPGGQDRTLGVSEGNDPENWFLFRSAMDLTRDVELDTIVRYVDELPNPLVPAYAAVDFRLGWYPTEELELSIAGQNILGDPHREFGSPVTGREVERTFYGKVTYRF